VRLGLPSGLFPSGFSVKTVSVFFICCSCLLQTHISSSFWAYSLPLEEYKLYSCFLASRHLLRLRLKQFSASFSELLIWATRRTVSTLHCPQSRLSHAHQVKDDDHEQCFQSFSLKTREQNTTWET
jgi:hypothetical protein